MSGPAELLAAEVGEGAAVSDAYGLPTVDVPPAAWVPALTYARDVLGCTYFDWLSAVDELAAGFRIVVHVANLTGRPQGAPLAGSVTQPQGAPLAGSVTHQRLLVRTLVPRDAARLATATGVYKGAAWHERETHEMFGVGFDGHPNLVPLLLPDGFEGHPLRKEFVLAARAAKAWPGAKEPGESDHGRPPTRRRIVPPGVPDPDAWGPRPTGTEPKEPAARPERPTRGDRPVRTPRERPAAAAAAPEPPAAAPPEPEPEA